MATSLKDLLLAAAERTQFTIADDAFDSDGNVTDDASASFIQHLNATKTTTYAEGVEKGKADASADFETSFEKNVLGKDLAEFLDDAVSGEIKGIKGLRKFETLSRALAEKMRKAGKADPNFEKLRAASDVLERERDALKSQIEGMVPKEEHERAIKEKEAQLQNQDLINSILHRDDFSAAERKRPNVGNRLLVDWGHFVKAKNVSGFDDKGYPLDEKGARILKGTKDLTPDEFQTEFVASYGYKKTAPGRVNADGEDNNQQGGGGNAGRNQPPPAKSPMMLALEERDRKRAANAR